MKSLIVIVVAMLPGAALAQATPVLPGQWDIAVTTNSISMPDMPPEVAASMAGKTIHIKHCITAAEALRGPQAMLHSDKSCKFTKYQVLGNRMHAEMSCQQAGGTMTAVSDGSFTPTGFRTTGKTVLSGDGGMTMTATTVGTRTGACAK